MRQGVHNGKGKIENLGNNISLCTHLSNTIIAHIIITSRYFERRQNDKNFKLI